MDVVNKGEPACFLTHWPGMYANGTEIAFRTFRGTVQRLNQGFGDRIRWMKLSEIARYWAAKELTSIRSETGVVTLKAPFAAPGFTLELPLSNKSPTVSHAGTDSQCTKVSSMQQLLSGTWMELAAKGRAVVCIDLKKGTTVIS